MKKFALLLLAAVLLLSLTACGGETKVPSTAGKPLKELVSGVISAEGLVSLPRTDLEDIIGIDPEDFTEAVYMQDEGMGGREVLVLRASDKDAAARIASLLENYLENRRKETRNYAPEAYKLLEAAKVETKNLTVALISDEQAAKLTTSLLAGE